jgi:succinate dehydrogenase / fumarate reductase iron-sulfur subunit
MNQIMRLRRRATGDYAIKDHNNGYRHEKAFVSIIEKWGTLHEAKLLPDSYGEGLLGKLTPDAQINLIGSLPTALRGLASGKVTIPKVLHHHKLPDQDKIKDIYEKVEGRPERIELNLYIVGDEAEMIDDEPEAVGAPTEGEGA